MPSKQKLIIVLVFLAGILTFRFFESASFVKPQAGGEIKIIDKVLSEPVVLGQSQYFSLGNFRIRTKIYPEYHYGDKLEIQGQVGNNLLINYPQIKKVGTTPGLLKSVFKLRKYLLSQVSKLWPEPEASLFSGIILGHDSISADFRKSLISTGTIHIVVVSGQNVAMLAGFVSAATPFLKKRIRGFLIILAILFYTLLTGAQPPTVRAAIMGALTFSAQSLGRETLALWTLGVTGLVMLIFDPRLIFSISFQLSFLATLGIILGQPILDKLIGHFLPKLLKESLSVTLSAWFFTAPIIALNFAQFTPITPISNLFTLPVVPFLMVGGAVSLFFSLINLFLGQIVGFVPFTAAFYFTSIVENLTKIPFSTLNLPEINLFTVLGFYSILLGFVIWGQKRILADK